MPEVPETKVEVGRFSFDTSTETITGPADYFKSRGGVQAAVDKALSSTVYNYGVTSGASPSPVVAMLAALQTDYAEYAGAEQMFAALRGR